MIIFRIFSGFIKVLVVLLLTFLSEKNREVVYWQEATIQNKSSNEPLILKTFIEQESGETIFMQSLKDSTPLRYFKKVRGEVCSSKECRLLNIEIYWNITGRYLGFKLPEGEFLSKNDHEPFKVTEYEQLHSILADESLPLDKVSLEELVEKPQKGVDAISGATSKSIAQIVVKGAAYTTFKLWNIVNGSSMDNISKLTEKQLSPHLLSLILESKNVTDKLWALNRLNADKELTPELEAKLLAIISSDDFYLSYNALKTLSPTHLKSGALQYRLFLMAVFYN